jgi:hypothetical protein
LTLTPASGPRLQRSAHQRAAARARDRPPARRGHITYAHVETRPGVRATKHVNNVLVALFLPKLAQVEPEHGALR